MKRRVIFLDFDGVLNSVRNAVADGCIINAGKAKKNALLGHKVYSGFDPVAVALVYRFIVQADAYVVVSSAWRKTFSLAALRDMFVDEFGWDASRIIDMTGSNNTSYGIRGHEVQQWIDDNTAGIRNFQYIIIDDNSDFLDHQMKYLIKTDPYEGLLYRDYCKALKLFNIEEGEVVL